MKTQIVVLSVLAALSLATTAFATPNHAQAAVSSTHTPMTPQQEQALWQAAQTKLKADHLYAGPINGERSDDTKDAIRVFQTRHHLPQTGNLDRATRQALGI